MFSKPPEKGSNYSLKKKPKPQPKSLFVGIRRS